MLKPDKGQYMGSCNITACQQPPAKWYNHSTHELNHYNHKDSMELFSHELCTLGENKE